MSLRFSQSGSSVDGGRTQSFGHRHVKVDASKVHDGWLQKQQTVSEVRIFNARI